MAKKESFTCDVCGATKGEGNRWLMGYPATERINSIDWKGYALADWNPHAAGYRDMDHLCSEKCAFTRLGEHIRKDVSKPPPVYEFQCGGCQGIYYSTLVSGPERAVCPRCNPGKTSNFVADATYGANVDTTA